MAALRTPASFGGLVRYTDEYKSKIKINPKYVIFFIILVIVIEIILNLLY